MGHLAQALRRHRVNGIVELGRFRGFGAELNLETALAALQTAYGQIQTLAGSLAPDGSNAATVGPQVEALLTQIASYQPPLATPGSLSAASQITAQAQVLGSKWSDLLTLYSDIAGTAAQIAALQGSSSGQPIRRGPNKRGRVQGLGVPKDPFGPGSRYAPPGGGPSSTSTPTFYIPPSTGTSMTTPGGYTPRHYQPGSSQDPNAGQVALLQTRLKGLQGSAALQLKDFNSWLSQLGAMLTLSFLQGPVTTAPPPPPPPPPDSSNVPPTTTPNTTPDTSASSTSSDASSGGSWDSGGGGGGDGSAPPPDATATDTGGLSTGAKVAIGGGILVVGVAALWSLTRKKPPHEVSGYRRRKRRR